MTGISLAAGAGDDEIGAAVRAAPIILRTEDSLTSRAAPVRGASAAMTGIILASLAAHGVLVAMAVISTQATTPPAPHEISVEIVQDLPKPQLPAKPPTLPPKPKSAVEPTPKKSIAAPTVAAKAPQPVAARDPVKPETPPEQHPPVPAKPAVDPAEIASLEKELSALRAQKAALEHSLSAQPAPGGPLTKSLQAIALPSIGADGEVAGYQELVFSQLAKAKGDGEYHGAAGTTGVHFEVDAEGRLLHAEVATSSGSAALDEEALAIVRRAAPFPPPPAEAERSFDANVNFRPSKA